MGKLISSFEGSLRLIVLLATAVLLFVGARSLTRNSALERLQAFDSFEMLLADLERHRNSDFENALQKSGLVGYIQSAAVTSHLDITNTLFFTDTFIDPGYSSNPNLPSRNNSAFSMHFDPSSPETTVDTYSTLLAAAEGGGDIDTYIFDAQNITKFVKDFVQASHVQMLDEVIIHGLISSTGVQNRHIECSVSLRGKAEEATVWRTRTIPCTVGETYRFDLLRRDGDSYNILHPANDPNKPGFQILDMPLFYVFHDLRGMTAKEAHKTLQDAAEDSRQRENEVVELEGLKITDQLVVIAAPPLLLALQLFALAQLLNIREKRYTESRAIQDSAFFGFFHNLLGICLNLTGIALLPSLSAGILLWRFDFPADRERYLTEAILAGLIVVGALILLVGATTDSQVRAHASDSPVE